MKKGYPLTYSGDDAKRAASLLSALTSSPDMTARLLQAGAIALLEYSLPESYEAVIEQALSLEGISGRTKVALTEDMAFRFRELKDYEQLYRRARSAFDLCHGKEDVYLWCLTLRDVAEGEWYLGLRDQAIAHFSEVESHICDLKPGAERFGIYFNLACAFKRICDPEYELRALKGALRLADQVEPALALRLDAMLAELEAV